MKMTFLTILISLVAFISCEVNEKQNLISIDKFHTAITDKKVQLLDVRTKEEFNSGYIEGALHADWNEKAEFEKRVNALQKDQPVYVYCLSGGRSQMVMEWLTENGFEKVYNLEGGIAAWKKNEFPVVGVEKQKHDMTMEQVELFISSDKKVLVDVGASWCPPCQKMKPIIHQLEGEGIPVMIIDGDKNDHIAEFLKVDKYPEFLIFQNGKEIKRFVGITDIEELRNAMN